PPSRARSRSWLPLLRSPRGARSSGRLPWSPVRSLGGKEPPAVAALPEWYRRRARIARPGPGSRVWSGLSGHHHDAISPYLERSGERDVERIDHPHREALQRRLFAVGRPRRDLALHEPQHLEADCPQQRLERAGRELPQVIGRLAQHDPTGEVSIESQGQRAGERVGGDG